MGGNAVAAWVARVDEAAVRNTQDVDILLRRGDLEAAKAAMAQAGFVYRHVKSIDMFLDGPDAKARDAVHILFAGEKVRADDLLPAPEVNEAEVTPAFRLLNLESLVAMKLTSFRLKDRVHLLDMIDVGLIDASWLNRFPEACRRGSKSYWIIPRAKVYLSRITARSGSSPLHCPSFFRPQPPQQIKPST